MDARVVSSTACPVCRSRWPYPQLGKKGLAVLEDGHAANLQQSQTVFCGPRGWTMAAPLFWTLCVAGLLLSVSQHQGEAATKNNERNSDADLDGLKHGVSEVRKDDLADIPGHGEVHQETLDKLQHVLRLFKQIKLEREQSPAHKAADASSSDLPDEQNLESNGKRDETISDPGASHVNENNVLESVKTILEEENTEGHGDDHSYHSQSEMDRLLNKFAFLEVIRNRLVEDNKQEKKNIITSRGDNDLMSSTKLVMQGMLQDCTRSAQNAIYDTGMYTAPIAQAILYNAILRELSSVYADLQSTDGQTQRNNLLSAVDSLERALGAEALTVIVIPKMGRQGISSHSAIQKYLATALSQTVRPRPSALDIISTISSLQADLAPSVEQIMAETSKSPTREDIDNVFLANIFKALAIIYSHQDTAQNRPPEFSYSKPQQTVQQVQSVLQNAQIQGVLTQPETQAIQTAVQESPKAALTKIVQTLGDKAGKTPLDQLQTIQTIEKVQGDLRPSQISQVLTGLQESPQKAMQVLQTVIQETTDKKTQATQQTETTIQTLTTLGRLTEDDSTTIRHALQTSSADAVQTIIGVVGRKVDLSDTDRQRLVTIVQNNKDRLGSQDVFSVVQALQTSPQQAISTITQTLGRKTGQPVSVHFTGSFPQQVVQQAEVQQTVQQVQSVLQNAQLQGVLTQPETQAIQTAVQESPKAALTKIVQTVGDKAGKTPLDQLQTIQTIEKVQGDLRPSQISQVLTGLQESPQKAMQVLQTVIQETTDKKTQATQQTETTIQTLTTLGRLTEDDSTTIRHALQTSPADAVQTIIGVVGRKVDLSDTDRQRLVTIVQNNKDRLGSQDVFSVVQALQTSPQQAISTITQTLGRKTGQPVSVHFTGSFPQQVVQQAEVQQTVQQVQSVLQNAQLQGVLTQPETQAIQTAVQESPKAALTKIVQTVGDKAGKTPLDQLQTIQTIEKVQGDLRPSQISQVLTGLQESPQKAMQVLQTVIQETTDKKTQATQQTETTIQTLTTLGRLTEDDSTTIRHALQTSPADAVQTIIGVVGRKVDLSDTDRQRLVTIVQNNKDRLGSQDVYSVVQALQTSPQQAISTITQTLGRKTGQPVSVHFTGSFPQQVVQQAEVQQTVQQVQSVLQNAQLQGVLTQPETQAIQTAVQESPKAALTKIVQTVGDKAGKTPLDQLQTIQTIEKVQGDLRPSQISQVLTGLQESPQKAMQVLQTVIQETTDKKTQATQQTETTIQTLTTLGRLTEDDSTTIRHALQTSPADAVQTIIGVVGRKVDLSDTDRQRLVTIVQNNKDRLGSQDVYSVVQALQTSPQQAISTITQTLGRKTGQPVSVHFTGSFPQQVVQQAEVQQTVQQVQSVLQNAQLQGVLTQPETQAIQTAVQESPKAALTKIVQTLGDKAGKTPLDQLQTIQTIEKVQGDLRPSQISQVLTGLQESPQKAMQVLQTVIQETTDKKTQATQQTETTIQTLTTLGRLTEDDSTTIRHALQTSPADAVQTIIGVVGRKVDLSDTDRQRLVTIVQNNKDRLGSQDVYSVVQALQTSPQQAISTITQTLGRKTGQPVSVHFTGSFPQQVVQQAEVQQTVQQVQSVLQNAQLQGVLTQPETQAIQTAVQESPKAALTKIVQTLGDKAGKTPLDQLQTIQTIEKVQGDLRPSQISQVLTGLQESPQKAMQVLQTVIQETTDKKTQATQQTETTIQTLTTLGRLTEDDSTTIRHALQTSPADAVQTIIGVVGRKVDLSDTDRQRLVTIVQNNKDRLGSQDVYSVVQALQTSPQQAISTITQTLGRKTGQPVSVHFTGSFPQQVVQQAEVQQTVQQVQSVLQNAQLQGVLTQPETQAIQTAVQESPKAALTKIVQTLGDKAGKTPLDQLQTIQTIEKVQGDLRPSQISQVLTGLQESPQKAMQVLQTVIQETTDKKTQATQQTETTIQTLTTLGRLTEDDSTTIRHALQTSPADAVQTIIGVVGRKVDLSDTDRQRLVTIVQNNKDRLGSQDVYSVVQALQTSPQQAISTITQTLGRKTGQPVSVHFTGSFPQQVVQQAEVQQTVQQVQSVLQNAQLQGVLTQPETQAIQTAVQESPKAALTKIVQTLGDKAGKTPLDQLQTIQTIEKVQGDLRPSQISQVLTGLQESPQKAMQVLQTVIQETTDKKTQATQQTETTIQTLTTLGRLTEDDSTTIRHALQTSPADAVQTIIGVVGRKVDLSDTDRQRLVTIVQNNKDRLGSQDVYSVVQALQTSPQQAISTITQTLGRKTGQPVSVHFTGSFPQQVVQQAEVQQTVQQVQSVLQNAQLQGVLTQPETQAIQTAVQESPKAALTKIVQTLGDKAGKTPLDQLQTIQTIEKVQGDLRPSQISQVLTGLQESPQKAMQVLQTVIQETTDKKTQATQQTETTIQTLTTLGRLTEDDSTTIRHALQTSPADAVQTIIGVVGRKVDLSDTDRQRLVTIVQNNKDRLGSQDVYSVVQALQTSPQQAISTITQTLGRKTGQPVSVHFTGSFPQQVVQQAEVQQTVQQVQSVLQNAQLQGVLTQPETQAIQTAVQESPKAALTKIVQTLGDKAGKTPLDQLQTIQTIEKVQGDLRPSQISQVLTGLQESPQKAMQVLQTVIQETTDKKTQATQQTETTIQTLTTLGRLTEDDSTTIRHALQTSPADAVQTIIGVVGRKVDLSDTDRQRLVTIVQNNKDRLGSQDVYSVVQALQTSPQQAISTITQTLGRKTGQPVTSGPAAAEVQQTVQQVQSVLQNAQLQGVLTQPETQAIQTAVQESPKAALTKIVQTLGDKAGKTPLDQLQTIQTIEKVQGDLRPSQISQVLTGLQESPQKAMQVLQTVIQETTDKKTQATQQTETTIQTLTTLGRLTEDDSTTIRHALQTSPADAVQTIIGVVGRKVDLSDTDRQRLVTIVQNNKDRLGSQDVYSVVQALQTSPQQAISTITQTLGRKTGQPVSVHFTGSFPQQVVQQAEVQQTVQQVQSVLQNAQLQGVLTQPETQAIQTAVQESPKAALTKIVQTLGDKAGKTPLDQLQTIQTIEKVQGDLRPSQISQVLTGLQESPQKAMQVLQTVIQETTDKKTQATQQTETTIQTLTTLGRLTEDDSTTIRHALQTSPADAVQTIIGVVGRKVDLSDTDRQRLVTIVQNNKDRLGSQDVYSVVQALQTSPQQAISTITQTLGRKTGQPVSVHFTGSFPQQVVQQAEVQQTVQQVQSVLQNAQLQGVLTQPETQAIQTAVQESPKAALTKIVQTLGDKAGKTPLDQLQTIQTIEKVQGDLRPSQISQVLTGLQESPQKAMQVLQTVIQETTDKKTQATQQTETTIQTLTTLGRLTEDDSTTIRHALQTSPADAVQTIIGVVGRKVDLSDTDRQRLVTIVQNNKDRLGSQDVYSVVQALQTSPQQAISTITQTLGRKTGQPVSVHFTGSFPQQVVQQAEVQQTVQQVQSVLQNAQLQGVLTQPETQAIQTAVQESPKAALTKIVQTLGDKAGKTPLDQLQTIQTIEKVQGDLRPSQISQVLTGLQESPQKAMQVLQTVIQETTDKKTQATQQTETTIQTLTTLGRLTEDDSTTIRHALQTSPADAVQTIIGVVGRKVDLSDTDRQRLVTIVQNNKDRLGSQDVYSVVQALQTSPQQAISTITQTLGRKTGQPVSVHFTGSFPQQVVQQAEVQQTVQQVQSVLQNAQLQGVLTQPETQAIQTAVQESPKAALTKIVQTLGDKAGKTPLDQLQTIQTIEKVQGDLRPSQISQVLTGLQESPQKAMQVLQTVIQETTDKKTQATQQTETTIQTLTTLGRLTEDDSTTIRHALQTSPADAVQTIIGVVGRKVDLSDTDRQRLVTIVQNNKDRLGSQDVYSVVQALQTSPQQAISTITQTLGRKTGQPVSVHFTGSFPQQVVQQQAEVQQTVQQVQSVLQNAQLQGVLTQPETQAIQTAVQESPKAALTKIVQTLGDKAGKTPLDQLQTIQTIEKVQGDLRPSQISQVLTGLQESPQKAMQVLQTVIQETTDKKTQATQQTETTIQTLTTLGRLTEDDSTTIRHALQTSPADAVQTIIGVVGRKVDLSDTDRQRLVTIVQNNKDRLGSQDVYSVVQALQTSPQQAISTITQTLGRKTGQPVSVHFTGSFPQQVVQQAEVQQTVQQVQSVLQNAQLQGVLTQPETQAIQTATIQTIEKVQGDLRPSQISQVLTGLQESPQKAMQVLQTVIQETTDKKTQATQQTETTIQTLTTLGRLTEDDSTTIRHALQTSPADAVQTIIGVVGRKVDLSDTDRQRLVTIVQNNKDRLGSQDVYSVVQALQTSPQQAISTITQTLGRKTGQPVSVHFTGSFPQQVVQQAEVQQTVQQVQSVLQNAQLQGVLTQPETQAIQTAVQESPKAALTKIVQTLGDKAGKTPLDQLQTIQTIEKVQGDLRPSQISQVLTGLQESPQKAMQVLQTVIQETTDKKTQATQQTETTIQTLTTLGRLTEDDSTTIRHALQTSPADAVQTIIGVVGRKVDLSDTDRQRLVTIVQNNKDRLGSQDVYSVVQALQTSPQQAISTITQTLGRKTGQPVSVHFTGSFPQQVVQQAEVQQTVQQVQSVLQNAQLQGVLTQPETQAIQTAVQESPKAALTKIVQTLGDKAGKTPLDQLQTIQTIEKVQGDLRPSQISQVLTGLQESPQKAMQVLQTVIQETTDKKTQATQQTETTIQTLTTLGRLTEDDSTTIRHALQTSPADAVQTIIGVVGRKVDLSDTDRQRLVTIVQNNKDRLGSQDVYSVVQALQTSPQQAISTITQTLGRKTGQPVSVHFTGSFPQQVVQQQAEVQQTVQQVQSVLQNAQLQGVLTQPETQAIQTAVQESPKAALTKIVQTLGDKAGKTPLDQLQTIQTIEKVQGDLRPSQISQVLTGLQESPQKAMQVLQTVIQETTDKKTQATQQTETTIQTLTTLGRLTEDDSTTIRHALQTSPADAVQTIIGVVGRKVDLSDTDRQRLVTIVQNNKDRLGSQDVYSVVQALQTSPQQAISTITQTLGRKTGQPVSVHFTGSFPQQVVQQAEVQQTVQQVQSVLQNAQLQGVLTQPETQAIQTAVQESPKAALTKIVQTLGDKAGKTPLDQLQTIQTIEKVQGDLRPSQISQVLTGLQESPQKAMQVLQTVIQETTDKKTQATQQTETTIQTLTTLGRLTEDDSTTIRHALQTSPADAVQTIIGVVGRKVDLSDTDRQRLVTIVQNNKDRLGSQDVYSVVQALQTSPQQAISTITQTLGRKTGQPVSVHFTGSFPQQVVQQAEVQQTVQQVQSVLQNAQLQGVLTQPETQAIQTAVQESPKAALTKIVQTLGDKAGKTPLDQLQTIQTIEKVQGDLRPSQISQVLTGLQESPQKAMQVLQTVIQETTDKKTQATQQTETTIQTLTTLGRLTEDDSTTIRHALQTSPADAVQTIIGVVGRKVDLSDTDRQRLVTIVQNNKDRLGSQDVYSVVQALQTSPQQAISTITQTLGRKTGQPVSVHFTGSFPQQVVQQAEVQQTVQQVQSVLQNAQLQGVLTQPETQAIQTAVQESPKAALTKIVQTLGDKAGKTPLDQLQTIQTIEKVQGDLRPSQISQVLTGLQESPQKAMQVLQTVIQETTDKKTQATQQTETTIQTLTTLGRLTEDDSTTIRHALQTSPADAVQTIIGVVGRKVDLSDTDRQRLVTIVQNNKDRLGSQDVYSVVQALQTSPQQAISTITQTLGRKTGQPVSVHFTGSFPQQVVQQQAEVQQTVQQVQSVLQNAQLQGVLTQPETQAIQTAVQESPKAALTKIVQTLGDKAGKTPLDQLQTIQTIEKVQGDLRPSQISQVLTGLQESPQKAMQVLQTVIQETTDKKTQATQQTETTIQTLTTLGRLTEDDSTTIRHALQTSPADAVQTIIGVVGRKVDLSDTDRQRLVTIVQNNKDRLGSQDVFSVVQALQTSPQQAISTITQTLGRKTGQPVSVHFTGSFPQQVVQQAEVQQTVQQVQSVLQNAQLQGVLTQPETQAIQTAVQESPKAALTKIVQTLGDKAGKTPLDQLQTIQTIEKVQGDLRPSQISQVLTGLQESPQKAMQVLQTVIQETTDKKTQATQQTETTIQTLTTLGRLTEDDSTTIRHALQTSPADAVQTIIGVVGRKVDLSDTDRQRLVTIVQNNKDRLGSQDVYSVVQALQTSPQQAISTITQTLGRKTGQPVSVHFTGSFPQQVVQQQAEVQQTVQQVQSVLQNAQLQGVLTQPETQAIQTAVQESPKAALTKIVQTVGDKAGKTPLDQLQTIQTIEKVQGDLRPSQISQVLTGLQESPQKAMQVLQTVIQETTDKKTQATQQTETTIQTLTTLGRLTEDDSTTIRHALQTSPADAVQTIIGVVGRKVDLSDTDRQRLVTIVQNNKDRLGSQDVFSVVQALQTSPQQAISTITQTLGRKTGQPVSVHFTGSFPQQVVQQAEVQQTVQQVQSVLQNAQLQGVLTQPETQAIQTAVQESPKAALTKIVQTLGDKAGKTPLDQLQTIQTIEKVQGDLRPSQISQVLTGLQESPQKAMQVLQTVIQETTDKKTQATQQTETTIQTLTTLGRLTEDDSTTIRHALQTSPADAVQTIIGVVGRKVDLSDTDRQRLVTIVQNNKDRLGSQDVYSVVQALQTSPQQAISTITQTLGRKTGQTFSLSSFTSTSEMQPIPELETTVTGEIAQASATSGFGTDFNTVLSGLLQNGKISDIEYQTIKNAYSESPDFGLRSIADILKKRINFNSQQLIILGKVNDMSYHVNKDYIKVLLSALDRSDVDATGSIVNIIYKRSITVKTITILQQLTRDGVITTEQGRRLVSSLQQEPSSALKIALRLVGAEDSVLNNVDVFPRQVDIRDVSNILNALTISKEKAHTKALMIMQYKATILFRIQGMAHTLSTKGILSLQQSQQIRQSLDLRPEQTIQSIADVVLQKSHMSSVDKQQLLLGVAFARNNLNTADMLPVLQALAQSPEAALIKLRQLVQESTSKMANTVSTVDFSVAYIGGTGDNTLALIIEALEDAAKEQEKDSDRQKLLGILTALNKAGTSSDSSSVLQALGGGTVTGSQKQNKMAVLLEGLSGVEQASSAESMAAAAVAVDKAAEGIHSEIEKGSASENRDDMIQVMSKALVVLNGAAGKVKGTSAEEALQHAIHTIDEAREDAIKQGAVKELSAAVGSLGIAVDNIETALEAVIQGHDITEDKPVAVPQVVIEATTMSYVEEVLQSILSHNSS
ncbi:hypothetical protein Bbelb_025890 [Branchiostoma belcheri]|nr:hypothetical protein Bbelb_025890 [Branchiostoma belcheri]